jgi:hypothetical protein
MELFSRFWIDGCRGFRNFQKVVTPIAIPHPSLLSAAAQKTSGLLPPFNSAAHTGHPALSIHSRRQMMPDQSSPSFAGSVVLPGQGSELHEKKRAVRRIQLVATAEVTARDTETKLSARMSELGLGGCYVDTLSPFPTGTLLHVRIIRDGGAFECEAKVVYIHDGFGMGIAFTNMAIDQRRVLENWIASLITQSK